MVNFGNFARVTSLYVSFHLGTLHGYFFTFGQFEFPVRTSNRTFFKPSYVRISTSVC